MAYKNGAKTEFIFDTPVMVANQLCGILVSSNALAGYIDFYQLLAPIIGKASIEFIIPIRHLIP